MQGGRSPVNKADPGRSPVLQQVKDLAVVTTEAWVTAMVWVQSVAWELPQAESMAKNVINKTINIYSNLMKDMKTKNDII